MKVVVCVASKIRAAREIAQAVREVLAEKGLGVSVVPPGHAGAIEQFDAVVLGSAVDVTKILQSTKASISGQS